MSAGKVAVVTGAGRGLGQRVALGLAEHGLRIVVVARSADQVNETVQLIETSDATAIGVAANVGSIEDVESLKATVHAQLGPVSVLVNAAGIFGPIQPIVDSDPQRWIETIGTNTI